MTGQSDFYAADAWVRDLELDRPCRRVLPALMLYMDRNSFECFPSRNSLARNVGCTVGVLDGWLKQLVALGVIATEPRFGKRGGQLQNLYRLNVGHQPSEDEIERVCGQKKTRRSETGGFAGINAKRRADRQERERREGARKDALRQLEARGARGECGAPLTAPQLPPLTAQHCTPRTAGQSPPQLPSSYEEDIEKKTVKLTDQGDSEGDTRPPDVRSSACGGGEEIAEASGEVVACSGSPARMRRPAPPEGQLQAHRLGAKLGLGSYDAEVTEAQIIPDGRLEVTLRDIAGKGVITDWINAAHPDEAEREFERTRLAWLQIYGGAPDPDDDDDASSLVGLRVRVMVDVDPRDGALRVGYTGSASARGQTTESGEPLPF